MEQNHELNITPYSSSSSSSSSFDAAAHGNINVEEYFKSLPPGYRFCPEDSELVLHYLAKKANDETLPPNLIRDVDFYENNPWGLTAQYEPINETEWYFFSPRYKKYANGSRPDRKTPGGYWKPSGKDKPIPARSDNPLGFKKTLDFYKGDHKISSKTEWKMHEYTLKASNNPGTSQIQSQTQSQWRAGTLNSLVLCKLYKKNEKNGTDHDRGNYASMASSSSIDGGDHEKSAATTHYQQPMPVNHMAILSSSSSSMLNTEEASSSSSSKLMLPENNNNGNDHFGDRAAVMQPIHINQGLLHDSQMTFTTDVGATAEDNKHFWDAVEAYCAAPGSPPVQQ